MWLTTIYNHKILDIEKISKKGPFFPKKSVDKSHFGLLYYSSTHPEKTQLRKGFEISSENF